MEKVYEKRLEKLNEVYEYLRSLGKIHTKKDFANNIGFNESNMSSAFQGKEKYLTNNLFEKICRTYSDLLNIDYFIEDKGEMIKNIVNQNNVDGDNIQGQNFTVNKTETDKFLFLLKTKDEQISKSQEQIDRLIGIIEQMNKN